MITEGKNNENTTDLPLLLNASETANKFNYQLDELNQLVQKARTESRVLNQYKDLIEQSRRQFAAELNAVLPDVDLKAKQGKLSEDDLNALITHAHLRVDQLKRQLTDQQVRYINGRSATTPFCRSVRSNTSLVLSKSSVKPTLSWLRNSSTWSCDVFATSRRSTSKRRSVIWHK